jgi:hypothetical protein
MALHKLCIPSITYHFFFIFKLCSYVRDWQRFGGMFSNFATTHSDGSIAFAAAIDPR